FLIVGESDQGTGNKNQGRHRCSSRSISDRFAALNSSIPGKMPRYLPRKARILSCRSLRVPFLGLLELFSASTRFARSESDKVLTCSRMASRVATMIIYLGVILTSKKPAQKK